MLEALAQPLLPLGGQAAEFGIVLQRAVLLIGREICIAAQPIPRMTARLRRIRLRTGYLGAWCWRRRGLTLLGERCSGNRDGNDTVRRCTNTPPPWLAGFDRRVSDGSLPRTAKAAGCRTWSPFWRNVTNANVVESHALGLQVLPWTVNDPRDMARLIEQGVDGLITDYPDRARRVMADKGIPLP